MKKIPRRTLLKFMATIAAAGFAGGGMSATQKLIATPSRNSFRGKLSYSLFSGLMGQTFSLVMVEPHKKYRVLMQLVEINSVFLSPNNDQFNIVFRLSNETARPNGVYTISHATAGNTQLFLQPLSHGFAGNFCIANFNLLT